MVTLEILTEIKFEILNTEDTELREKITEYIEEMQSYKLLNNI